MLEEFFPKSFLTHLLASDGILLACIIIYNLLALLLPLIKLSFWGSIGVFIVINFIILALKGVTVFLNQRF